MSLWQKETSLTGHFTYQHTLHLQLHVSKLLLACWWSMPALYREGKTHWKYILHISIHVRSSKCFTHTQRLGQSLTTESKTVHFTVYFLHRESLDTPVVVQIQLFSSLTAKVLSPCAGTQLHTATGMVLVHRCNTLWHTQNMDISVTNSSHMHVTHHPLLHQPRSQMPGFTYAYSDQSSDWSENE